AGGARGDAANFAADFTLMAAAVIGEKYDEGVVFLPGTVDGVEYAPDGLIETIDLGGVDGHAQVHVVLVFFGERGPGGNFFVAVREWPGGLHDTQFLLACVAVFAEFIPALAV